MTENTSFNAQSNAQDYYGNQLQTNADLKTSACCPADSMPDYLKPLIGNISDGILSKFYGCGSPIPEAIKGCTILDLGCGTGRDVFLASQLVGEDGYVYGIDMTKDQLEVAKKHTDSHISKFGYSKSNVSFHLGEIEDLQSAGIEDNSIDVVMSNCVINLSDNKEKVFKEIFRVLKPGGELYFSDVYASRRIPEDLRKDPVLHGECLSGALYTEDFRRILLTLGISDFRIMSKRTIAIDDPNIAAKLPTTEFYSITVRAFKLPELEDLCEDYGQVATYLGGIETSPYAFRLDDHHLFEKGKPELVCGNTASMLQNTRFDKYFKIDGDTSTHFGLFDCSDPKAKPETNSSSCC